MELIPKIGILVGITAVVIMLPLIGFSLYNQLSHEFGALFVDQEGILEEFYGFKSYELFKEKYPDSYDQDRLRRDGSVRLEVQAIDFDTGNRMELRINYDAYDNEIRQNAHCDINDRRFQDELGSSVKFASAQLQSGEPIPEPEPKSLPSVFLKLGHAEDDFVEDFIVFTNCLELGKDIQLGGPIETPTMKEPEPES